MVSIPIACCLGAADSDSVNLGSNPGPPANKISNENQRLADIGADRKRRKNRTDRAQTDAQESAQRKPRDPCRCAVFCIEDTKRTGRYCRLEADRAKAGARIGEQRA